MHMQLLSFMVGLLGPCTLHHASSALQADVPLSASEHDLDAQVQC